ncbi:MAG: thioredoxin family protein [Planctomycetales bacterium]|nr:thioredoxin family protein [Planctomycetales bacterium]
MVHVALSFLFAIVGETTAKPLSYEDALAQAQKEKKPLLILVGARWCASCQIMKRDTIEPMKESGDLKDVVVTYIDKDERPELAEKLMKGQTLPQIVLFSKNAGNWRRFSLTGMQSKARMAELLGRADGTPVTLR